MPKTPPARRRSDRGIDRRAFLRYVGAGASLALGGGTLGTLMGCAPREKGQPPRAFTAADGTPDWQPPGYPVPLPGDPWPRAEDAVRLAQYQVSDDLVLPEGFQYHLVARWGDRFGPAGDPARQIDFGYNNDYTGLVPIAGSDEEYYLLVNHEYICLRPWLAAEAEDGRDWPALRIRAGHDNPGRYKYGLFSIDDWQADGARVDLASARGQALPAAVRDAMRRLSDAHLAAQGVSVLRVRRAADGRVTVVAEAGDHKRVAGCSHANVAPAANGGAPFALSGPAATLIATPPRGTFCNCSGGTTPWGTFLTCEENFQYHVNEEVTPEGTLLPGRKQYFGGEAVRINGRVDDSIPVAMSLRGTGHAASEPLDGRHYGWVGEVDPRTGALTKHTALGRFRHENVAVRVEAGRRLAAYMGDDRRGGHVWKYVSDEPVADPRDAANSALLTRGTLYVARFEADFTGRWVPLRPDTSLSRPEPEHCPSGHLKVPARYLGGFVAVGDTSRDEPALEVEDWQAIVERFAGKPFAACTLGDLVRPARSGDPEIDRERQQGVILMDAFAMANAAGGTPTARPEDLEVHPLDGSVYIAFTDATDSSDGSPDQRIFPDARRTNSRQYGAVYRLLEDGDEPAAETFTWGKFVGSGEVAEHGGGFACADNLVFDPEGNLWMVTDITTTAQNFPTSRTPTDGTAPGGKQFPGVFGNNAMFMIPTRGPRAGIPHLFAIGPSECELCGPTFTDDGRTLILSVQHPGEHRGMRSAPSPSVTQRHVIHDRDDRPFEQVRTVPMGSNFPSGRLDTAPRPAVVSITRKA